jgi:hypothetical protein
MTEVVNKEGEVFTLEIGVWEHYKGGRYNVLGIARHHDTGELGVVYHGLQDFLGQSGPEPASWNWRPVFGRDGWFSVVKIDIGTHDDPKKTLTVPRFSFVTRVVS